MVPVKSVHPGSTSVSATTSPWVHGVPSGMPATPLEAWPAVQTVLAGQKVHLLCL